MGLTLLLLLVLFLGVDKMEYIELKDSSVKYNLNNNVLYLRLGIWDYTEITIEREAFEKNNSDFDKFVTIFTKLLNGHVLSEMEFTDPYWLTLIHELIENNLIIRYREKNTDNICILTEKQNCKKISKYSNLLGKNLKIIAIDDLNSINKDINYLIILGNPDIRMLEKLNKSFFKANQSWSLAIIDGKFMHLTKFVPNISGCFKCFELNNSIRMADYENYIDYIKNEDKLIKASDSIDNVLLALHLLLTFTIQNSDSLRGQLLSVYLPNLEFNIEPLQKSSLCDLDGIMAQSISEDLNIDAQNTIERILRGKDYD